MTLLSPGILKDIRTSSLDAGCLLSCSLSRWYWGPDSNETRQCVPLGVFHPCAFWWMWIHPLRQRFANKVKSPGEMGLDWKLLKKQPIFKEKLKKTFRKPAELLLKTTNHKKVVASWNQNNKKWNVAQDFCTMSYIMFCFYNKKNAAVRRSQSSGRGFTLKKKPV